MKPVVLIALFALLFTGCGYNFFAPRTQSRYTKKHAALIPKQTAQLRKLDTLAFQNGAVVRIKPVMIDEHGTGIYGYHRSSSHFGRIKFFEYKADSVKLIPRANEDSLLAEVKRFLSENNFSKGKIRKAQRRVKTLYDVISTDSF